jgi:NRPS condensation-like uncharacterized protein
VNVYKVEAFDVWNFLFSLAHCPQMVRWRGDFDGFIDLDTLGQAVEASYKAMPLIAARFVDGLLRPAWRPRTVALDEVLQLVERPAEPEAAAQAALAVDVDIAQGPQLRLTVIRQDDHDTLCAVVNHMLCDGVGFKDYLAELSRLYSQIAAGRQPDPLPPLPRGIGPVAARYTPSERLHIALGRMEQFNRQAIDAAGAVSFERPDGPDQFIVKTVPAAVFEPARLGAKALGGTVNDLLMAAFARAWCAETGACRMALPSTVDLRAFLPPGQRPALAHLAGNCMVALEIPPGQPLADTLQQVSSQMAVHKQGIAPLRTALKWPIATTTCPYPLLKRNYGSFLNLPGVSFSNIGVIDPEKIAFAGLALTASHLCTAVKPPPYFQLVATSFQGSLTLSANLRGDGQAAVLALRVFQAMADEFATLKPPS